VVSYSYCYSDTTYGVTGNAAGNGTAWAMGDVLPDGSPAWVQLEIGGLAYKYTLGKNVDDDTKVHVRNEDAVNGGYIFEETDDWSGRPGGTIQKYFRFPYSDHSRWGKGSIDVEGEGTITDPVVTYNYKMTVNEELMLCSKTPLADPSCPGYAQALADYLANIGTPDIDDPFYDEWVQAQLDQEAEVEEEEVVEATEEEEGEDLERQLGSENTLDDLGNQQAALTELAQVQKIEPYYMITIPGGMYEETVVLEDADLPDNRRALRNLASDSTHRSMVRSQYDR
jgi:hypothetical protein